MKMQETLIPRPDDKGWVTVPKSGGMRVYTYWEDKRTGASISLLDVPKGAEIPIRHRHASNQFMYCIEGSYRYLEPGLTLEKGAFYMNPKGHPHGPTVALSHCLLLEIYDGPHYFELPAFHTRATVGKIAGRKSAGKKGVSKKTASGKSASKSSKKASKAAPKRASAKASRSRRSGRKA
jgi:2,4'-dihydroxyacetophenone dioxygenase